MTALKRDDSVPLIEQVREATLARAGEDDALDFIPVALELGCSRSEAERMDETLTVRAMVAQGAI